MGRRTARANGRKSSVRAKVEHVFAHRKDRMGLRIRTIRMARAKAAAALASMAATRTDCAGSAAGLRPLDPAKTGNGPDPALPALRAGRQRPQSSNPDLRIGRNGRNAAAADPRGRPKREIKPLSEVSNFLIYCVLLKFVCRLCRLLNGPFQFGPSLGRRHDQWTRLLPTAQPALWPSPVPSTSATRNSEISGRLSAWAWARSSVLWTSALRRDHHHDRRRHR